MLDSSAPISSPSTSKRSGRLFGGIFSSAQKRSPSLDDDNDKDRGREKGEKGERGVESGSESGKEGGSVGQSVNSSSPKRQTDKIFKEKEGKEEKRARSAWSFSVPLRSKKLNNNGKKTDSASSETEVENSSGAYEPFSSSLDFLNLGFQELVKCRQVCTCVRAIILI